MLGAHVGDASGQRHVDRVGGDAGLEGGVLELVAALLEGGLDAAANLVGELAHARAFLGAQLAHLAQHAGERALLARHGHADAVELGQVCNPADALGRLGLDGLEVVDDRHCFFAPFVCGRSPASVRACYGNKKTALARDACEQGR